MTNDGRYAADFFIRARINRILTADIIVDSELYMYAETFIEDVMNLYEEYYKDYFNIVFHEKDCILEESTLGLDNE